MEIKAEFDVEVVMKEVKGIEKYPGWKVGCDAFLGNWGQVCTQGFNPDRQLLLKTQGHPAQHKKSICKLQPPAVKSAGITPFGNL